MREDGWREDVGEDFNELGGRKIGAKIKIRKIKGAEESVSGDNGVKKGVDGGERRHGWRGDKKRGGGHRPRCPAHVGLRPSHRSGRGWEGRQRRETISPVQRDYNR